MAIVTHEDLQHIVTVAGAWGSTALLTEYEAVPRTVAEVDNTRDTMIPVLRRVSECAKQMKITKSMQSEFDLTDAELEAIKYMFSDLYNSPYFFMEYKELLTDNKEEMLILGEERALSVYDEAKTLISKLTSGKEDPFPYITEGRIVVNGKISDNITTAQDTKDSSGAWEL